jgi:Flp pilus assembly protein TadG
MKPKAKYIRKRNSGAALVEGVIALMMIIMGTVGAVLLMVNTGMSMYYKQKLSFVAQQAASYIALLSAADDIEVKGEDTSRALMQAMGMDPNRCTVHIELTTVQDLPAVSVTLATDVKLFGKGDVLPLSIKIQDTAVAIKGSTPDTLLWLRRVPPVRDYLIPVIAIPPGGPARYKIPVVLK